MTQYALLSDRAVLTIAGDDAIDFLQGLITKDARKIGLEPLFAALLSPQGRFLHDFFIVQQDGIILLETDASRLSDLIKRFTMYRLRSKVTFTQLPHKVTAFWNGPAPQGAFADPRLPAMGARFISETLPGITGMQPANYDAHRIALGIAEGAKDLIVDRSLALEYGYDEMGAVDFDKGCYVGQEVTARSKHRATLRKFIHQVKAATALPAKGTPVMAGARDAGVMASSAEGTGLAHLKVEEVARAAHDKIALTADGVELTATLPGWCKTAFADGVASS